MIFAHQHRYEAVAVEHSTPGPFLPAGTVILWHCACNDVTSTRIDGRWTLSQVRGERELTGQERAETELLLDTPSR
jgi:hypothetical protein